MNEKSAEMEKFLDEIADHAFGRSRTLAIAGRGCVKCGRPANKFRGEIDRKEFLITGYCQACQDDYFGSL
jgi:hypothetical protein